MIVYVVVDFLIRRSMFLVTREMTVATGTKIKNKAKMIGSGCFFSGCYIEKRRRTKLHQSMHLQLVH
jgi:hypothetical protein